MLPAILFLAVLGGVYAFSYYLNHKTPVPEGCENLKADCEGCHDITCGHNPKHTVKKGN